MLDEAKRLGIVEISLKPPIPTVSGAGGAARALFRAAEARVLSPADGHRRGGASLLGSLGALVLGELLKDHMIVGIAWGTASQAVVRALSPRR